MGQSLFAFHSTSPKLYKLILPLSFLTSKTSGSALRRGEESRREVPVLNYRHPSTIVRISASGTAPSRMIDQSAPRRATIVDAKDAPVAPPSRISGKRSPSCFSSDPASLHAGNPERFALVPVIGPPAASINAHATADFGQRNATRPLFPVTFNGNPCVASTTIVNAPGQNFCASFRKLSGKSRASFAACSIEFTKIGNAFVSVRPFTRNTCSIDAKL